MTKVRVDMALLTGHDYIAIEEATGKPITEVLGTARGIYAAGWRARIRNGEPAATFEDTLNMTLTDFDIVNDASSSNGDSETGKVSAPDTGVTPPLLPGSGV